MGLVFHGIGGGPMSPGTLKFDAIDSVMEEGGMEKGFKRKVIRI